MNTENKKSLYMLTLLSSILNEFFNVYVFVSVCVGHLCRCARGQQRASDLLELEICLYELLDVGARNQTQIL